MSGTRNGITGIVYTQMFWESLENLRSTGNYLSVRTKLRELITHRVRNSEPHPREVAFSHDALKGLWHCHLKSSPLIVLIYGFEDGKLILHKLGDHRDYSWKGKNVGSDARTANRIHKACHADVASPFWPTPPRWVTAEDIMNHPDIPELDPSVLDILISDIDREALEGIRFLATHGYGFSAASLDVQEQYMEDMIKVLEFVIEVREKNYGVHFDNKNNWQRYQQNKI